MVSSFFDISLFGGGVSDLGRASGSGRRGSVSCVASSSCRIIGFSKIGGSCVEKLYVSRAPYSGSTIYMLSSGSAVMFVRFGGNTDVGGCRL